MLLKSKKKIGGSHAFFKDNSWIIFVKSCKIQSNVWRSFSNWNLIISQKCMVTPNFLFEYQEYLLRSTFFSSIFWGTGIGCLPILSCSHIKLGEWWLLVTVAALSSLVAICCRVSPNHSFQEMVCQGLPQYRCSRPWLDSGHIVQLQVEHLGLVAAGLSDWACLLRNNHRRRSFTVESDFFVT